MKQQELIPVTGVTDESIWGNSTESTWETQMVYREMADVPVQIVDPLEDLSRNLNQLQDMQARLRFMVREIRYMMKV